MFYGNRPWAIWCLSLFALLPSPFAEAVTMGMSAPTTAPGDIAALQIDITDATDEPHAVVFTLTFDVTRILLVDVVAGVAAADATLDVGSRGDGLTIVIFGGSGPLSEGILATINLRIGSQVAIGSTLPITPTGVSAANADAEELRLTLAQATINVAAPDVYHDADTDGDGRVGLSEVLRAVQLYRLGPIYCDESSEDGYTSMESARDCPPHDLDYAPQDWRFNLSELLRCIQFYNAENNAYHIDENGEDGFAPGPAGIESVG